MDALKQEIGELKRTQIKLRNENSVLQRSEGAAKREAQESLAERNKYRAEAEALREQVRLFQKKVKIMEEESRLQAEKYETLHKSMVEDVSKKQADIQGTIDTTLKALKEVGEKNEELIQQNRELRKQNEVYRKKEKIEERMKEIEGKAAEQKGQLAELRIKELEENLQKLTEALTVSMTREAEAREQLASFDGKMKEISTNIEKEVQAIRKSYEDKTAELASRTTDAEKKLLESLGNQKLLYEKLIQYQGIEKKNEQLEKQLLTLKKLCQTLREQVPSNITPDEDTEHQDEQEMQVQQEDRADSKAEAVDVN